MALQDDDAFTAVHDLAVCLFIPVFHGSAGGRIGTLGVDQQLVQVGGVVVMRCRIQEPPPVSGEAVTCVAVCCANWKISCGFGIASPFRFVLNLFFLALGFDFMQFRQ